MSIIVWCTRGWGLGWCSDFSVFSFLGHCVITRQPPSFRQNWYTAVAADAESEYVCRADGVNNYVRQSGSTTRTRPSHCRVEASATAAESQSARRRLSYIDHSYVVRLVSQHSVEHRARRRLLLATGTLVGMAANIAHSLLMLRRALGDKIVSPRSRLRAPLRGGQTENALNNNSCPPKTRNATHVRPSLRFLFEIV